MAVEEIRIVTGLRAARGHKRMVMVSLNGDASLQLSEDVVVRERLTVGRKLAAGDIVRLKQLEQYQSAWNTALSFLKHRPRSEFEVRSRLKSRGCGDEQISAVMSRLRELELVDDAAFASFWRENRERHNPRSSRLTRWELRRKGITEDVIEQALDGGDEKTSAYEAARLRVNKLPKDDYAIFRRRLGDFLRRRGFNYEIIGETVNRLWGECGGGEAG